MAAVNKQNILEGLKKTGFSSLEIAEIRKDFYDYTGYPTPIKRFMLSFQQENYSVEEMYYWMVGHGTQFWQMPYVHKITDIFAASQSSSIFGDTQQRLNIQQNNASQYLATVGNMSKDLFKRVRELRQIRERLTYYKKCDESLPIQERTKTIAMSAENTLKDAWINMIEGGSQNPGSVYGMAKEVGFTTLPDHFFQAPPLKESEIKKYVDSIDTNPSVKTALERKLYQFYHWKNQTFKELGFKENMQKKLIYQHYQSMRLYLNWVKPYLKNIARLSQNQDLMNSASLISSFQTNIIEIEVILQNPLGSVKIPAALQEEKNKKTETMNAIVILHFFYETQPTLDYHSKNAYQQTGPIHIGRVDASLRCYAWTDEELEKYKSLKINEDIDMLEAIDYTLKDDAELLGDDLKAILNEVKDDLGKKLYAEEKGKEKKEKVKSHKELLAEQKAEIKRLTKEAITPFSDIFGNLGEIFLSPFNFSAKREMKEIEDYNAALKKLQGAAIGASKNAAWQIYKNYKKAHRMITW